MLTSFVFPGDSVYVERDVIDDIDARNELLPEVFAQAELAETAPSLTLREGTHDIGRWLGKRPDAFCRVPFHVTVFESGMVEARPGGGRNVEDFDRLETPEGDPMDPILHLPQQAETLVIVAHHISREKLVIAGLITLLHSEALYGPHDVASVYIEQ